MHYYELRWAHLRLGPLLLMRKHCLLASAASLQLHAKLFPSGINRVTICIYIESWSAVGMTGGTA